MNVSLTPALERFIRRQVAAGLYNNASEVVRESLRLLLDRDRTAGHAVPIDAPPGTAVRAQIAALEPVLRGRGVTSVALFGSVARREAGPSSDVDILIDVDPDVHFSLIDLFDIKALLESRLQRPVDVVTRGGLNPRLEKRVIEDAETVF